MDKEDYLNLVHVILRELISEHKEEVIESLKEHISCENELYDFLDMVQRFKA